MKRTSWVSALLVGGLLAASSAAEAQTTPPPPSTPAPPSPTQPAVSVGGATTPGSDTPSKSASDAQPKPAFRPFAGSSMTLYTSMTTNTVFKGQTQYNDPTVESSLWITPRYAFNDTWQLRGRLIVNYEYTNSDTTTFSHEPQLSDLGLQMFYRSLPKFFEVQPLVSANLNLPTSKISQSRTMLFSPGATLQLSRPFEKVLGGEVTVIGSLSYSHPIYRSANAEVVDPRPPGALQCVGAATCSDLVTGTMNPSDALSYALIVAGEWGKWAPGVMYLGASQWTYHPKEVRNPVDGSFLDRPAGFEPTSVRQTHYFSVLLDYNFAPWITGEVGFWNSTSALGLDGKWANPFFNRYEDTRVYVSATLNLDNFVKLLQGGREGEAGIVRAQNKLNPFRPL